jgi:prepilin-type N-terminal cleavage/methylation domain-containing protein
MRESDTMSTERHQAERGFTLVELMASIGLSAIVLLATLSLMGLTQSQWEQGKQRRDMTSELSLAVEKIVREVRATHIDSIAISAGGDTLYVGGGTKFYKDGSTSDLMYESPSTTFPFLEDMTSGFSVQKPYIDPAQGDTLSGAIRVTVAASNGGLADSTSVVIVPRAK